MKKIIYLLLISVIAIGLQAQDKTPSIKSGKTYVDISFDASDTINESETYWIEVTNMQPNAQVYDIWIDLTDVSGTPSVEVQVSGKKFADDTYVNIGTAATWTTTDFNYPVDTVKEYRFIKILFTASATEQQTLIAGVEVKTWNTGGEFAAGSAAYSGNVTVGGTFGVTGASTFTAGITANGGVTLGAGDDLIGSSTSDITINTDKFTVAGATGDVVVGNDLDVVTDLTAGTIASDAAITAITSVISPVYDVTGATGITIGSADVTAITLSGISEDLVLTPSANTWTLSTSTGVTAIAVGSINLTGVGTIGSGKISSSGGISFTSNVTQFTELVTLTATEIVGTDAGDVGHADGAILVAAPGTGFTLEFVSAFFVYDYSTAAYTGGGDDVVVQVGVTGTQVAVTGAITGANLLEAAADAMLGLGSTATELVYADNGAISLYGTALTQPGTAAGVLRCYVTYNVITTGL